MENVWTERGERQKQIEPGLRADETKRGISQMQCLSLELGIDRGHGDVQSNEIYELKGANWRRSIKEYGN